MNRGFALVVLATLAIISACVPAQTATAPPSTTPIAQLPGAAPVCAALNSDKFDLVLKSYGAAADAINLLIDVKAIKPGSARAVAIANGNDKVLAALTTAENARRTCNASSYTAALAAASAGLSEVRAALHSQ